METFHAVIAGQVIADTSLEAEILRVANCRVSVARGDTPDELTPQLAGADALLVQNTTLPVNAALLEAMPRCKIVVRYGVGYDNVDVAAAHRRGVAVCNVPDYAADEVADHAFALALALSRQLLQLDASVRAGEWSTQPPALMPALSEMLLAVAGFGRIGRAVLERAGACNFRLAAYDPFVDADSMAARGVEKLDEDEMFARADVISLHLPLSDATRHFVSAVRLRAMKRGAILVNTARGGLIDTPALALALQNGALGGAGLDVFEDEPLPAEHPLRACRSAFLTPHLAWHSQSSMTRLQRLAAEEAARALRGEPLRCPLGDPARVAKSAGDKS